MQAAIVLSAGVQYTGFYKRKERIGMKHKISLEQIEKFISKSKDKAIAEKFTAGIDSYKILCDYISEKMDSGEFVPIKRSGLNGKRPPLYNVYWKIEEEKDSSGFDDELNFKLSAKISTEYYKKHTEQYKKDRNAVLKLSEFLKNDSKKQKLEKAESVNERSFEIWNDEKFIKCDSENKSKNENRGRGKRILKNLGLDFSDLNVYETPEPFVSYTFDRLVPQNVLIIENKDTFYTIRKYMQDTGKNVILGEKFGTIIYGSGKKVIASFRDFEYTAEKYLAHRKNKFLYFGDMDYEGIGIYEKLVEIFKEKSTEGIIAEKMMVEPFKEAYIRMYEKAERVGMDRLPVTKEKQNRNIGQTFASYFGSEMWENFENLLLTEKYIPQEIINIWDFE